MNKKEQCDIFKLTIIVVSFEKKKRFFLPTSVLFQVLNGMVAMDVENCLH